MELIAIVLWSFIVAVVCFQIGYFVAKIEK